MMANISIMNYGPSSPNTWQLQHAKAQFSEMVRRAEQFPQIVTVHGHPRVVVMSFPLFKKLLHDMAKPADLIHSEPTPPPADSQTSQNTIQLRTL